MADDVDGEVGQTLDLDHLVGLALRTPGQEIGAAFTVLTGVVEHRVDVFAIGILVIDADVDRRVDATAADGTATTTCNVDIVGHTLDLDTDEGTTP